MKADALFAEEKVENFVKFKRVEDKSKIDLLTAAAQEQINKHGFAKTDHDKEMELKDSQIRLRNAAALVLENAAKNVTELTPEVVVLVSKILNPESTNAENSSSLDKDLNEFDLMLKEQEVLAKKIENLKADIERKQMNDRYKQNKQ